MCLLGPLTVSEHRLSIATVIHMGNPGLVQEEAVKLRSGGRLKPPPGSFALFYLSFAESVQPYLDPGTGSLIFQILLATFLGGVFAVKLYWNRLRAFLKRLLSRGRRHGRAED